MKTTALLLISILFASGCSTAKPTIQAEPVRDPLLAQYDSSARAAFADGNYERAERFYELSLKRARVMDAGPEIAKSAYNQGACLLVLKRPELARNLLREAASELERQKRDPSSAWLLEAQAERALKNMEAATMLTDRVLGQGHSDENQLQAWLLKGELAIQKSQQDIAAVALKKARHLLKDDPVLRAGVSSLAGKLAMADGKPMDAAINFDKQAVLLQQAARWSDMADALFQAGLAYSAASQHELATLRFYRAARSQFAQCLLVESLRSVERAAQSAGRTTNEGLATDIARLLEEINQAVTVGRTAIKGGE